MPKLALNVPVLDSFNSRTSHLMGTLCQTYLKSDKVDSKEKLFGIKLTYFTKMTEGPVPG